MKTKKTLFTEDSHEPVIPVTQADMHAEATQRLELLVDRFTLNPQILRHWEGGCLSCSLEDGSLLQVKSVPLYSKLIKEFEQQYGCLVYHAVVTSPFLTLLFVRQYGEDWHFFYSDEIFNGWILAYVYNLQHRNLSEMGEVQLSSDAGSLIRIG